MLTTYKELNSDFLENTSKHFQNYWHNYIFKYSLFCPFFWKADFSDYRRNNIGCLMCIEDLIALYEREKDKWYGRETKETSQN